MFVASNVSIAYKFIGARLLPPKSRCFAIEVVAHWKKIVEFDILSKNPVQWAGIWLELNSMQSFKKNE